MRLTRILFKGMGVNQFGRPEGVWITEEQVNELVRRQYDPDRCDKPMRLGGKWVIPKNFLGEDLQAGKRELVELVESSATFCKSDIEGLAEAGYLGELKKIDCRGYKRFVDELADSGQYKLESGENDNRNEINQGGVNRLAELKRQHRLGGGNEN